DGPYHLGEALRLHPRRGSLEEPLRDGRVVDGLEHPEEPGSALVEVVPVRVIHRSDPPDHLAVAAGEEQLGVPELEPGGLLPVEEGPPPPLQRPGPRLGAPPGGGSGTGDTPPRPPPPAPAGP